MKAIKLYRKGFSWSIYPSEGAEELDAYFLHTKSQGDFNRLTYALKRQSSTRSETRSQVFFVPLPEAKFKNDLSRAKQFFTAKDGCLFGALIELRRMGEIVNIAV
jgi:hypothetical protein